MRRPTKQVQVTSGPQLQLDFFDADLRDISTKADIPSLEFPLFALRAGVKTIRRYERKGISVEVQPGAKGGATVYDQDLWFYCAGQLRHALDRGLENVSRAVCFTAYDFLRVTHRGTSGRSYERLGDALERLAGTRIVTNIATAGQRERRGFGLLDSFRIVERNADDRMVSIEVVLPDWLYRSICDRKVLTVHPEYYKLRGSLERRIYALCRKHCGSAQKRFRIGLVPLREKAGSVTPLRQFRHVMKKLAEADELPGYRLVLDTERDLLTVYSRSPGGQLAALSDQLQRP